MNNEMSFKQWLTEIPRKAIRSLKKWSTWEKQIMAGGLIVVIPTVNLWPHISWLTLIIFLPPGTLLILRGIWNSGKE